VSSSLPQALLAAVTALAGALLVCWSVPKIAASLAKAPAVAPLAAVHRGTLVSGDRLQVAIEALRTSLTWERNAAVLRELGLLELVLSDIVYDDPALRSHTARSSLTSSTQALADAPVSPHTWTRLAYAELTTVGPTARIGELLASSLVTGAAVPELTFARLDLLLRAWPEVRPADRQLAGIARLALAAIPGAPEELDRILSREDAR
jgi:hypothetical protein